MGNLLVSPITDKETHRGEISDEDVTYAVSSMQGWRVHMEDAHICQPVLFAEERIVVDNANGADANDDDDDDADADADTGTHKKAKTDSTANKINNKFRKINLPNHSLFAVFDGHGGSFAAEYSGLNFVRVLSRQPSFVQYANFVQEQHARDLMEHNQNSRSQTIQNQNSSDQHAENIHSNSSPGTGSPNQNQNDDQNNSSDANANANANTNSNNINVTSPVQQAQIHRRGLELLEQAFRDAFLDLDREIWRVGSQLRNEDGIFPTKYNNDNNDNGNGDQQQQQQDAEMMYSLSQEDSGTTAVAVMLTPQYIICANAGDSRSVYSKQGNCTIPLSYDHKPDDEAEERRIIDAGGCVRVGRVDGDLAVSRGLGDFRFKEHQLYESMGTTVVADMPHLNKNGGSNNKRTRKRGEATATGTSTDGTGVISSNDHRRTDILPDDQKVSPVPDIIVQKRDSELDEFIVIACDGIFDVQTNHECIALTADIFKDGENDLGLLCEEILDLCLLKGSKDNMTALVIKFPSQKIGVGGGGVMKRREERRSELEEDQQQAAN